MFHKHELDGRWTYARRIASQGKPPMTKQDLLGLNAPRWAQQGPQTGLGPPGTLKNNPVGLSLGLGLDLGLGLRPVLSVGLGLPQA